MSVKNDYPNDLSIRASALSQKKKKNLIKISSKTVNCSRFNKKLYLVFFKKTLLEFLKFRISFHIQ